MSSARNQFSTAPSWSTWVCTGFGDLGHPKRVFGLLHLNLPVDISALRSLGTFSTNLPSELPASSAGCSARREQVVTRLVACRSAFTPARCNRAARSVGLAGCCSEFLGPSHNRDVRVEYGLIVESGRSAKPQPGVQPLRVRHP
jgi:hypothetical protein